MGQEYLESEAWTAEALNGKPGNSDLDLDNKELRDVKVSTKGSKGLWFWIFWKIRNVGRNIRDPVWYSTEFLKERLKDEDWLQMPITLAPDVIYELKMQHTF